MTHDFSIDSGVVVQCRLLEVPRSFRRPSVSLLPSLLACKFRPCEFKGYGLKYVLAGWWDTFLSVVGLQLDDAMCMCMLYVHVHVHVTQTQTRTLTLTLTR